LLERFDELLCPAHPPQPTHILASKLTKIGGRLRISDHPKLTTVDFRSLVTVGSLRTGANHFEASLDILSNLILKSADLRSIEAIVTIKGETLKSTENPRFT
jgi:hypothetical protein